MRLPEVTRKPFGRERFHIYWGSFSIFRNSACVSRQTSTDACFYSLKTLKKRIHESQMLRVNSGSLNVGLLRSSAFYQEFVAVF